MSHKEKKSRAAFSGFSTPNTTATPDEFFDVVLAEVGTLSELKVIAYTIRRTFGFKKAQDWISIDQYVNGIVRKKDGTQLDYGTGLSSPSVSDGLKRAVEHGYLVRNAQCPLCEEIISERENITVKFKSRHNGAVRDLLKDVVPRTCPFCHEKLRGRERMVYGLKIAGADGYLKVLVRGNKDSLLGVTKTFSTQHTDVQETVVQDYVNVASSKNEGENGDEAVKTAYLVQSMATELGDENVRSRATFKRILAGLGESTVWHLLGNTKEAFQDGIVQRSKRAAYFTGMAKNVAKERGIDLGFKNGRRKSEAEKRGSEDMRQQLSGLRREIGNRKVVEDARAYP